MIATDDSWDAYVRSKVDDLDTILMRPLYVLRAARGRWVQLMTMKGFEHDDPKWHDQQQRSAYTRMLKAQREIANLTVQWVRELPTWVQARLDAGLPLDDDQEAPRG